MKSLAKETAIYGVSSILGKFLNWLLVPLFTRVLTKSDYGIMTELYAWIALMVIILTYGMETSYFRFAADKDYNNPDRVYSTTMSSVGFTAVLFMILSLIFYQPFSDFIQLSDYSTIVLIMLLTVSVDAFISIPFAYLRFKQRPVRFMVIKLVVILVNIFFNLLFFLVCPALQDTQFEGLVNWFYDPSYKAVGYVIIANCLSTVTGLLCLLPDILAVKFSFDRVLLKRMLKYAFPLLLLGIAGIMNQTVDRLLFRRLFDGPLVEAEAQLGIYNASFKVAMVMMMFTYAFRFAYEPFIFAKKETHDSKATYSLAMNYFVVTVSIIYLLIITFLDVLKLFIGEEFRVGIAIIPFVLVTYAFQGIYYNLSLWYKLTDRTIWGTYLSLIGFAITLVVNIVFIPRYSYWACVFASMLSFFVMMVVCYFVGQKYYPIRYNLRKIIGYFFIVIPLGALMLFVKFDNIILNTAFRLLIFVPFLVVVLRREFPIKDIWQGIKAKLHR